MCHHYQLDATIDELLIAFSTFLSPQPGPQQPIATGRFYPPGPVPVLRLSNDDKKQGRGEFLPMDWGLLPSWWKPSAKSRSRKTFQRHTFNARYETVDEKPSFREAFKHRRCLVPVTHFEENGHYFSLPDNRLFAFAGLWESWQAGSESLLSCTFLTTEANAEVEAVDHPRMPIILQNETEYSLWLHPDVNSCASLTELLRPAEDGLLKSQPL